MSYATYRKYLIPYLAIAAFNSWPVTGREAFRNLKAYAEQEMKGLRQKWAG